MAATSETVVAEQARAVTASKKGHLPVKIGATICFVLIFVISLSSLLDYFNFEKSYTGIVRSRFEVLLGDLGHNVEYGLGLGLSLPAIRNIPSLIDQAKASDPNIQFINVFDKDGRILFDTDRGKVGRKVPANWLRNALRNDKEAFWHVDLPNSYIIGLQLDNSFDQREGAIVLAFAKGGVLATLGQIRLDLISQGGIAAAIFGALGMLLTFLVTGGLTRRLKSMERRVRAATDGAAADDGSDEEVSQFVAGVNAAVREIEEACSETKNE